MLDIMAVGAHPDDIELACGGLLLVAKALGYKTGAVDMTKGEMGSRGTVQERMQERETASKILGLTCRKELDLPDSKVVVSIENRHKMARLIRELRPKFVIAPWIEDKHPDHEATGKIVIESIFDARLEKLDLGYPPYKPSKVFFYASHIYIEPTFVVDITDVFEDKMKAIYEYKSQFSDEARKQEIIPVSLKNIPHAMDARSRHYGSMINVEYGEGFVLKEPFMIKDPFKAFPY
jgi:N-acetylglucosamine malate deacetylase 1